MIETTTEITLNSNYFCAHPGMKVRVFQYWTVQGLLITVSIPVGDTYNCALTSSYKGRRYVGQGRLVYPLPQKDRWDMRSLWRVAFEQIAESPAYPRLWWLRHWLGYRKQDIEILWWLIRRRRFTEIKHTFFTRNV